MNYEYCNGYTYTIKQGDTLYEISKKENVPLSLLLRSNPFVDVFNLQVGDTICIPSREVPVPSNMGSGRPPETVRPETPMEPGMPVKPEMPVKPGTPEMPMESGTPVKPGMSAGSEAPGAQNPLPPLPPTTRPLPPLPPPPQVRMSEDETWENGRDHDDDDEDAWIRYVVQPGDTMFEILKKKEMLEDFIKRNGLENIYLLPGIAYYIPER